MARAEKTREEEVDGRSCWAGSKEKGGEGRSREALPPLHTPIDDRTQHNHAMAQHTLFPIIESSEGVIHNAKERRQRKHLKLTKRLRRKQSKAAGLTGRVVQLQRPLASIQRGGQKNRYRKPKKKKRKEKEEEEKIILHAKSGNPERLR